MEVLIIAELDEGVDFQKLFEIKDLKGIPDVLTYWNYSFDVNNVKFDLTTHLYTIRMNPLESWYNHKDLVDMFKKMGWKEV